jgi:hypothetical protein
LTPRSDARRNEGSGIGALLALERVSLVPSVGRDGCDGASSSGLGGAAAWLLVARAQESEHMRRIGAMMLLAEDDP